jgi:hypothetical protein
MCLEAFLALSKSSRTFQVRIKEFKAQAFRCLARVAPTESFWDWLPFQVAGNAAIAEPATGSLVPSPEKLSSQRLFSFTLGTNSGRNFVKHVTSSEGCMNSGPMSIDSAFRAASF